MWEVQNHNAFMCSFTEWGALTLSGAMVFAGSGKGWYIYTQELLRLASVAWRCAPVLCEASELS